MKLIAVFCIEEHKKLVKQLFAENNVPVFSGVDIRGFRLPEKSISENGNWFSDHNEYEHSIANFAFVNDDQAVKVMEAIERKNQEGFSERPFHAFQLDVEKFVA